MDNIIKFPDRFTKEDFDKIDSDEDYVLVYTDKDGFFNFQWLLDGLGEDESTERDLKDYLISALESLE